MDRPFDNRRHGTIQSQHMPLVTVELIDKLVSAFPYHAKLTGSENLLELGIREGHKQVIEWLQARVGKESAFTISGDPNDLKK